MPHWFSSTTIGLALAVVAVAPFHADGPPPGRTGGFNEASCHECHTSGPLNDSLGSLRIDALPASYAANREYRLALVLTRPGMLAGGFQLAIRTNDRHALQAGYLTPADDRTAFSTASFRPIQYLQHSRKGATLTETDTARWTFTWRAPAGVGAVVIHVAGNAANDDNSPFGDAIYTRAFVLPPIR